MRIYLTPSPAFRFRARFVCEPVTLMRCVLYPIYLIASKPSLSALVLKGINIHFNWRFADQFSPIRYFPRAVESERLLAYRNRPSDIGGQFQR
jgi:hypothetical protein